MASFESAAAALSLTVRCYSAAHDCEQVEVTAAAVLDRNYRPQFLKIPHLPARTLKPNESLTIPLR